jgi:hypothetical protein
MVNAIDDVGLAELQRRDLLFERRSERVLGAFAVVNHQREAASQKGN